MKALAAALLQLGGASSQQGASGGARSSLPSGTPLARRPTSSSPSGSGRATSPAPVFSFGGQAGADTGTGTGTGAAGPAPGSAEAQPRATLLPGGVARAPPGSILLGVQAVFGHWATPALAASMAYCLKQPDESHPIGGMVRMGLSAQRDYLSRVVVGALNPGACQHSRSLVATWLVMGSRQLRSHVLLWMRVWLRRGMPLYQQWGLPLLVAVAMAETREQGGDMQLAVQALSVLTEAATLSPAYRRTIVALGIRLALFPAQAWVPLAMALAAGWDGEDGGEGVAMLAEQGLLAPLLGQWRLLRQVEWVAHCDALAADSLTAGGVGLQGLEDPAGATASESGGASAVLESLREAARMQMASVKSGPGGPGAGLQAAGGSVGPGGAASAGAGGPGSGSGSEAGRGGPGSAVDPGTPTAGGQGEAPGGAAWFRGRDKAGRRGTATTAESGAGGVAEEDEGQHHLGGPGRGVFRAWTQAQGSGAPAEPEPVPVPIWAPSPQSAGGMAG